MKILLCHNYYQQPGGEDQSFADEASLIETHGHEVVRYTAHNDFVGRMGRIEVAGKTIWNRRVYEELGSLIRRERPAVMHCTNTFPLISPAAYYAARAEHLPVVQSLRNYRLLCLNGFFFRDGRVCEDCLGKTIAWPGLVHGCYRQDRKASAVVATMVTTHRAVGTWSRAVHLYFTATEFARQKFVAAGFPSDRIAIKPNFVHPDPQPGAGQGEYAVFVGRLSPEKGIQTLLDAWARLERRVPLKIVGDGPLAGDVAAARHLNIEWLGRRPVGEVLSILGEAACLVMPSVWYETFGRTIIEAFAKGTPVIASRLGAMAELVSDGQTGVLVEPGNASDLADKIQRLFGDPRTLAGMRQAAREEYERKYTAEPNYRMLMAMYEWATAISQRQAGRDMFALPALGPSAARGAEQRTGS